MLCTYLIASKFLKFEQEVRQSANQLKTIVYIIIHTAAVGFTLRSRVKKHKNRGNTMRTLQFIADCPKHGLIDHPPNECYITQEYVAALLYKQLEQYGFDAQHIRHEHQKIEVRIDNHHLPLSILCSQQDVEGHILCQISANPQQEQAWFERIETQSIIRQLAQAVENSLKTEHSFSDFVWKS